MVKPKDAGDFLTENSTFFRSHEGISLSKLADYIEVELLDKSYGDRVIFSVAPIVRAREGQISYIISPKSLAELEVCRASAIICNPDLCPSIPKHIAILLSDSPDVAFAVAGSVLYPAAMRPGPVISGMAGISPGAFLDSNLKLESYVTIEPMAVIGSGVEIGQGTYVGPGVIIGPGVKIGRNCSIAAGSSIFSALIGNGVILHNGVRIGQDGFGYAQGPKGMLKIVQIGRVIIQDNVEIGANSTIDRGTMDDTVIGEGTKIDNQVQIAHNVRIGCHCIIVSQVGIAGSAHIGDRVIIAGQSGIKGHVIIGDSVQIAAKSGVIRNIPSGAKYGGIPARPMKDFLRYMAKLSVRSTKLSKRTKNKNE